MSFLPKPPPRFWVVDTGLLLEPVATRMPATQLSASWALRPKRARRRRRLSRSSRVLSSGGRFEPLLALTSYGPLSLSLAKSTISLLLPSA
ncbi:hypothetical protein WR25_06552 [Diploscapter pachys]|uniref:Uncharacterized protein n=1 Tax=Diploscapter pachys TaxID=2018661 RepID=A0A2A2M5V4_9BILA|nr:hypothetical protein WR25_06552 [Diploscapter pachys]